MNAPSWEEKSMKALLVSKGEILVEHSLFSGRNLWHPIADRCSLRQDASPSRGSAIGSRKDD